MANKIGYNDSKGRFVPQYEIPEDVSELSEELFVAFCGLCDQLNTGVLTRDQASVRMALEVLGELPGTYNEKMQENIALVARLLGTLFDGTLKKSINPIGSFGYGKHTARSLGYGFFDATAGQYLHVVTATHRFHQADTALREAAPDTDTTALKEHRERMMDDLICALYPTACEELAQVIRERVCALPSSTRGHLVSYALASNVYLASGTFNYYSIRACFRDIFGGPSSKSSGSTQDNDFSDALCAVAETGAFGDYEKVLNTNIVIILRFMQKRWREAKKINEHAKRK